MSVNVATTIFSILFLGFLYVAAGRKVWRGQSGLQTDVVPDTWPFSDEAWQGAARSWIVTVPFLLVFLGGYLVHLLSGAEGAAWIISGAGFVGALGLMATITLFNRPRFVVPPHLRSEPGALAARRARRARRR